MDLAEIKHAIWFCRMLIPERRWGVSSVGLTPDPDPRRAIVEYSECRWILGRNGGFLGGKWQRWEGQWWPLSVCHVGREGSSRLGRVKTS